MAFPVSPTNGQQANINGITYTYSNTLTAWTVSTSVSNSFVSISVSGNVTSGNLLNSGIISSTGNSSASNYLTGGLISATGTVTGTSHLGAVVSVTGNVTGGNVLTGGLISATSTINSAANVTGGNILTGGLISATGNVSGSYFIGNGSALTGISAGGVTSFNGQTGAVVTTNIYSIGMTIWGRPDNATNYDINSTISGGSLYNVPAALYYRNSDSAWVGYTNAMGPVSSIGSGSWRAVGTSTGNGSYGFPQLWVRYA